MEHAVNRQPGYRVGNSKSRYVFDHDRYRIYNRGTNDDGVVPSKHYTISRFGLTFWPVNEVAFKIDFGTKVTEDANVDDITQLNIGVGYNF